MSSTIVESGNNTRLAGIGGVGELLSSERQPDGSKTLKVLSSASVASRDASGRQRTSNPTNLYVAKQIADNLPRLWDDAEVSGSGTTSVYNQNRASTTISVSNLTAGKRVRQTFRRYNYESGNSHLVDLSWVGKTPVAGIRCEIVYGDDNNGLGFVQDGLRLGVFMRSSVTGVPVDTIAWQDDADPSLEWNIDTLDGSSDDRNPSGANLDFSKIQVGLIDFLWLSGDKVRFGLKIGEEVVYFHQFLIANVDDAPYISTPNLPIRYSIENDGTGPSYSLECICASVKTEGSDSPLGLDFYVSTQLTGGSFTASATGTVYPVLGMQLRNSYVGVNVFPLKLGIVATTNDDFEWLLIRNPTITGGVWSYSDYGSSAIQVARGDGTSVVASPTTEDIVGGDMGKGDSSLTSSLSNITGLGNYIDGTPDTLVLCVRSLSPNLVLNMGVNFRELL